MQLQALEIILISFLVWSTYSKTIIGLTKTLLMLEQHLCRGLWRWKGQFSQAVTPEQVCSLVGLPGRQGEAQSPGSSHSLLQAGSAVEELSEGSSGWQALRSLLLSHVFLQLLGSISQGGLEDTGD